jgi:hypothetical protein
MNTQQKLKRDCAIRKAQRVAEKEQQKIDIARTKALKNKRVKKFTDGLRMIYINAVGACHCCTVRRDKNIIFIVFSDGELRKNLLQGKFFYR